MDRTVECGPELEGSPYSGGSGGRRSARSRAAATRSVYSSYGDEVEEAEEGIINLRHRVEDSGAIPLIEADIAVLTDKSVMGGAISKERVPIVVHGALDMLVVNILMVVYIP